MEQFGFQMMVADRSEIQECMAAMCWRI